MEIGFLCWSTMKMDKEALLNDIHNDCQLECGLQWKVIYAGKKGKIPEKDKVRALHVIIDSIGWQQTLKTLSDKYGKSDNGFPNNRRLRFYPHWLKIQSTLTQQKVLKAIQRQKTFMDLIQTETNQDILSLELHKDNKPSLRSLIGAIKSTKFPLVPLFVLVDNHYFANEGVAFQFLPHVADEASMMIRNLIPYLQATAGEYVNRYFYMDAVNCMSGYTWDVENKCVICNTDNNMEEQEETDTFGLKAAETYQASIEIDIEQETSARPDPTLTSTDAITPSRDL